MVIIIIIIIILPYWFQTHVTEKLRHEGLLRGKVICHSTLNNFVSDLFLGLVGLMHEDLHLFLETNVPKSSKKQKSLLGVGDQKLAGVISETLSVSCLHSGVVPEIIRGK